MYNYMYWSYQNLVCIELCDCIMWYDSCWSGLCLLIVLSCCLQNKKLFLAAKDGKVVEVTKYLNTGAMIDYYNPSWVSHLYVLLVHTHNIAILFINSIMIIGYFYNRECVLITTVIVCTCIYCECLFTAHVQSSYMYINVHVAKCSTWAYYRRYWGNG